MTIERSHLGRVTIAASAALLLLASCGSRAKDETALNPGGGVAPVVSAGPSGSGNGTTANMYGTIESPCGPNTSGATLTAGETGVTASEITITTISDPGGPIPGLNQSVFDSMVAFTDWCNGQGGINGRKLKLQQRDAKLSQYKDRILDACGDSFALVGSLGVGDDTGVDDYLKCNLVNVPASTVSAKASTADRVYQPLPFDPNVYPIGSANWVKQNYPDGAKAAGSFYTAYPPLIGYQNLRWTEAYKQDGFNFIERKAANYHETAWGPLVSAMKNKSVKYLTLTSSYEEVLPLQKEMTGQGYKPDIFELETNFYDHRYPEQAKAQSIETGNTLVRLTVWPFEEADNNPAMKTYLDQLQKSVPDAAPAELGVQAWAAGLLFATAAKKAGANLTRDGLLAALKGTHSWDSGGLHGPTDVGAKTPSACFVMMKVADGGFTRAYPMADKDKSVYDNQKRPGMACPDNALLTYTNPPKPD